MKTRVLYFLAIIFLFGCKEEFNTPIESNSNAPKLVTDIVSENLPGGAKVNYFLPKDPNLLYVLAEMKDKNGIIREFKSSHYSSEIVIDGLGNTNVHEVKVYSVSKAEVRSAPQVISIKPLEAPFMTVFKTLALRADFGGVNLTFENASKADLAIVLCANDSLGKFVPYSTLFTKMKEGSHTFRGMKDEENLVGVYIIDRWNNYSDTLLIKLTPLYEMMLDKSKFKDISLPGDASIYNTEWNIAKRFIWDGKWSSDFNNPYGDYLNVTTNGVTDGSPMHITFDLGVSAKLSRLRINHYYRFINKGMKKYEIWGSQNTPPNDGSWTGWIKLASHEQIKPSGLAGEQYTDDDKQVWIAGDNVNFEGGLPPIRYIRIKCLENWVGNGNLSFSEVSLWGNDK